jgi:hypothetical protein
MIKCSYLTTCEVTDDGRSLRLDFLDGEGQSMSVELPFEQAESVVMTLPHMLSKALQQRTQNKRLRYVFTPGHWSIEKADRNFIILTLATEDGFEVSFAIPSGGCRSIGAALKEAGESASDAQDCARPFSPWH